MHATDALLLLKYRTAAPHIDHLWKTLIVTANSALSVDRYMNVNLEQTEEYVSGQLKATYGDAFIRGNNILYILSATKLFNQK